MRSMITCVAFGQRRSSETGPRARPHRYPRQQRPIGYLRFSCPLLAANSVSKSSFAIALNQWLIAMIHSPTLRRTTLSSPWRMRHLRLWHRWRSENNYAAVWERLRDRYEDNNEGINHYLKSLTGLPSMSADLASALQLIDNFSNIFSNI